MAARGFGETGLVQEPTAHFMQKNLGWESLNAQEGEDFGPAGLLGRESDRTVILKREVLAALQRLNPGLPERAYTLAWEAIDAEDLSKSLIQTNEEKYRLLRDGVPVSYRDDAGRTVSKRLTLIDFDRPERNRYQAVRELWVRGQLWLRRPDVICFVNGLPLVFIELKAMDVAVDRAYKTNYVDYLETIPHLFHWNALIVIANGEDAQYGSITATLEYFYRWKRIDEDDPEPASTQPKLPILLAGMLDKQRLLDLVENFILFDHGGDKTQKIVARNHQFLGVNRVIARLQSTDPAIRAEVEAGKLGVFWHTQGSGKSYSMVFLSEKIHRKLSANYTFLIITDRSELDDQIAATYTHCGCANSQTDQARNGKALRDMLATQNRRYIFSLVHKHNQTVKAAYSERKDIIVISDEAHRTQYGELANNMRKALPNAKFIGFTGTPLIDAEENQQTRALFGDYVSKYTFKHAVADGATLPIFFEPRGDKLKLTDSGLNQRIADAIDAAKMKTTTRNPWSEEKEEKLYQRLKKSYAILTAPSRLEKIAQDIVRHFSKRWNVVEVGGGKGMLVCLDKITCVKMYDLIVDYWQKEIAMLQESVDREERKLAERGRPAHALHIEQCQRLNWMKETEFCVVVSQAQDEVNAFRKWTNFRGEPLNILPHREKMVTRKLEEEFKRADHPFRFVIVCSMWLTGFDVKSLATMYLDKPMQGHTLMQAIARVNRVGGGKRNGLVIDYNGMLVSLRKALAVFANGNQADKEEEDSVRDDEAALQAYQAMVQQARDFLLQIGYNLDDLLAAEGFDRQREVLLAIDKLSTVKEHTETFTNLVADLLKRRKGLCPHQDLDKTADERAIILLYNKLCGAREVTDISEFLQSLYDVIDMHLEVQHSVREPVLHDLSAIDLERLKLEFAKQQHIQAARLSDQLETAIKQSIERNPCANRYDLYEHYQKLVENYNQGQDEAAVQQRIDELRRQNDALSDEEKRYVREGMRSDDELAVFDLLQKPSLSKKEREAVKQVAKSLYEKLTHQKQVLTNLRDSAVLQAQIKSDVRNSLFGGLPEYGFSEQEIVNFSDAMFAHIYRSGLGVSQSWH